MRYSTGTYMASSDFTPIPGLLASLDLLQITQSDAVAHVRLMRPAKRNAISDGLIQQLSLIHISEPTRPY